MATLPNVIWAWILIFIIKEKTVFCQDIVGKCEPIKIEMCKGIGYNNTFTPSDGQNFQLQVESQLQLFKPLSDSGCSKDFNFFLCSFFLPKCNDQIFSMMRPCKEVCSGIQDSCTDTLEKFGLTWPEIFACSQLLSENDQPQQCLSMPTENSEDKSHGENTKNKFGVTGTIDIDSDISSKKTTMNTDSNSTEMVTNTNIATIKPDKQEPIVSSIATTPIVKESGFTESENKSIHVKLEYIESESGQVESSVDGSDDDDRKKVESTQVEGGNIAVDQVEVDNVETEYVDTVHIKSQNTEIDTSQEQPTSPCEPLHVNMCKQFGYNETKLPNFAGHVSLVEATLAQSTFVPLVHTGCSSQLAFLLCSVYTPACHERFPDTVPPCRSVCLNVQRECLPILNQFGHVWPDELECINFPLTREEKCLQGTADIFRVHWQPKLKTEEKSITQTFVVTTNSTVKKGTKQVDQTVTIRRKKKFYYNDPR